MLLLYSEARTQRALIVLEYHRQVVDPSYAGILEVTIGGIVVADVWAASLI